MFWRFLGLKSTRTDVRRQIFQKRTIFAYIWYSWVLLDFVEILHLKSFIASFQQQSFMFPRVNLALVDPCGYFCEKNAGIVCITHLAVIYNNIKVLSVYEFRAELRVLKTN